MVMESASFSHSENLYLLLILLIRAGGKLSSIENITLQGTELKINSNFLAITVT